MNDQHDLDDRLKQALREEDAELLARLERDPGLGDVLRVGFGGRLGWMTTVMSVFQVVVFGLGVWAAVRFLAASSADDRVFWGVCLLLAGMAVTMLKQMVWDHMERNLILREIKQLELQVATLSMRIR